MKKFTNAVIYGQNGANEILIENGVIRSIGRIWDQRMKLLI